MRPDRSPVIDVQFAVDASGTPGKAAIRGAVTAALEAVGAGTDVEVSVRVTGADEIRCLNRQYRRRDKATNVLSFPADPAVGGPGEEPKLLGDIVVCAPVLAEEARVQQKTLDDHWTHILVHGTLHLLGYDHEDEGDANVMEALETRILADRGIADPYSAR